jgi:glycosyltransferase involved in cell wall biosynthesis
MTELLRTAGPGAAKRVPVSAVMIVRDASGTLPRTLDSLGWLAEVVVYDNGSRDDTRAIAARYANVRVAEGAFSGFGPTRNAAAALASNDWIFAIDSDESVTDELRGSLAAADLADPRVVFAVERRNFLMGRPVRHSGWGDDWLIRLYNRRHAAYDDATVHESVRPAPGGTVRRLRGYLDHDAVRSLGDFLVKIDRYSEFRRGEPPRMRSVLLITARSLWAALKTLVLQLGVLDGWRGAVIAWSNASGVFFKYMKPLAEERRAREQSRSGP